jgi:hypothetical protein
VIECLAVSIRGLGAAVPTEAQSDWRGRSEYRCRRVTEAATGCAGMVAESIARAVWEEGDGNGRVREGGGGVPRVAHCSPG